MIITIAQSSVRLVDSSDFSRFSVAVAGNASDRAVAEALAEAQAGRLVTPDQVAISPLYIRRAAGDVAESAQWNKGFDAMLAYAESKNWMMSTGEILAHIEHIAESVD